MFEAAPQSWRPLLLPPNYPQVNDYPFTALSHSQQYHSSEQFTNSGADEAGHHCWVSHGTPKPPSPLEEPPRADCAMLWLQLLQWGSTSATLQCSTSATLQGSTQTSLAAAHPDCSLLLSPGHGSPGKPHYRMLNQLLAEKQSCFFSR